MQDFLFEWLSGAGAEAAVFASAFISSTLMPGGSEALLAGALSQTPDDTPRLCRLVLLATGRQYARRDDHVAHRSTDSRKGEDGQGACVAQAMGSARAASVVAAVVGDALPLAAGWLRMPAASCAVWVAVGKLLRYVVVAAGTLSLV